MLAVLVAWLDGSGFVPDAVERDPTAYYARLWAGPAVRSLGGRDVDFLAFWATYVF